MRFFGRIIKYLLRSVFSIIIFLLLVGLAKNNRNMGDYIIFLNTTDWTVFHLSQPASWTAPFWSQEFSGAIADIFPGDSIDAELSGLDDNDPNFQQDIDIPSSLSDETG
jgi:hypothetical protein